MSHETPFVLYALNKKFSQRKWVLFQHLRWLMNVKRLYNVKQSTYKLLQLHCGTQFKRYTYFLVMEKYVFMTSSLVGRCTFHSWCNEIPREVFLVFIQREGFHLFPGENLESYINTYREKCVFLLRVATGEKVVQVSYFPLPRCQCLSREDHV